MQLFKFETGKIFRRRFLIIALTAFLFLDAFNIVHNYSKTGSVDAQYYKGKYEFNKRLEGKITAEKVIWLKEHYEISEKAFNGKATDKSVFITGSAGADMNISREFLDEITRLYTYNDEITAMKEQNTDRLSFAREHSNSFLIRCAEKTEKIYLSRSISDFYDYYSLEQYLGYNSSMFFIVILLILAFSPVFASERESGMYLCFMSSDGGRKKAAAAKLSAMAVFTVFTLFVFTVFDLIVFCICLHLKGFSAPIYALPAFKFTPLTCSIWAYIVLTFFVRLLGFLIIGAVVLLISSMSKSSYSVFLCSLVSVFLMMLSAVYSSGALEKLNVINPIKLLVCGKMFSTFDVMEVLSYPVMRYGLSVIICLVFFALLCVSITTLNNKNARRSHK